MVKFNASISNYDCEGLSSVAYLKILYKLSNRNNIARVRYDYVVSASYWPSSRVRDIYGRSSTATMTGQYYFRYSYMYAKNRTYVIHTIRIGDKIILSN